MQNYQLPAISAGMTKSQIQLSASNSVDEILEKGNVIAAAESLSVMEDFIKDVKAHNRFIPYLREELQKQGKDFKTASGAKIELAETGTKYDYSKTDYFLLPSLYQQATELSEKIKQREAMLKTLPHEGLAMLDELTGEMVTVYPPSKTSTSSYKVTLAK